MADRFKIKDPRLNKQGDHIYLASPGFNPRQRAVLDSLGQLLEAKTTVPVFDPFKQGGVLKPDSTREERLKVLEANKQGVNRAIMVVAVLDYPLDPQTHELRVVQPTTMRADQKRMLGIMNSPPLNLTDNGVCFEMGFAAAAKIPVVGYIHDEQVQSLNVMLADSCEGVIVGLRRFRAWLENYKGINADPSFDWEGLTPWARSIR